MGRSQNPKSKAYCDDPVGVYVTTDDGESWSDQLLYVIGNATIGNTPHEYTANLSAYEGQSIKVGFRHYNVEDQVAAIVDYIVYAPQANQYTITWKVDGQEDVTETYAYGATPTWKVLCYSVTLSPCYLARNASALAISSAWSMSNTFENG